MKLLSLITALALSVGGTALAQEQPAGSNLLTRGYRGFVDGSLVCGNLETDGLDFSRTNIGIMTAHGFQFNPHIFLGGGLGFRFNAGGDDIYWLDSDETVEAYNVYLPIFAAFRYDIMDKKVSPFLEYRLGGYASLSADEYCSLGGIYMNMNFGVRIKRLNISCGYETMPGTFSIDLDNMGSADIDVKQNSFVFRVGVDVGKRR